MIKSFYNSCVGLCRIVVKAARVHCRRLYGVSFNSVVTSVFAEIDNNVSTFFNTLLLLDLAVCSRL